MKPTLPQGTRDFSSATLYKRNYIFQTIRNVFEKYGFEPLETPAFEQLETLTGKYGEEGDKLIFKILNNGLNAPGKKDQALQDFSQVLEGKSSKGITERALRYDLTIPFARYVAMNHGQITFPFKRYQIQPVWRADRPQRGRYREFYQCDADIAGSDSCWNEAELTCIYRDVFDTLKLPVTIRVNSRKILQALAEKCGVSTHLTALTIAIDKLDKVGLPQVIEELASKGFSEKVLAIIQDYLSISGTPIQKLNAISFLLGDASRLGIEEIRFILEQFIDSPFVELDTDFTLARGLDYYTGVIFEIKANGVLMGSIGGGGRYASLTETFGLKGVSGVGISFGVDRIYDVLDSLNLFPEDISAGTKILFFNTGQDKAALCFKLIHNLRNSGIKCELYPENSKFDKQFKYAERKRIAYVAIIGDNEMMANEVVVKHLETGKQIVLRQNDLVNFKFQ
jgi:histidyl-tRNA synthetase